MHPKDADGMANSVDSALLAVRDLSVPIHRICMVAFLEGKALPQRESTPQGKNLILVDHYQHTIINMKTT